jgi:hypothetical protein
VVVCSSSGAASVNMRRRRGVRVSAQAMNSCLERGARVRQARACGAATTRRRRCAGGRRVHKSACSGVCEQTRPAPSGLRRGKGDVGVMPPVPSQASLCRPCLFGASLYAAQCTTNTTAFVVLPATSLCRLRAAMLRASTPWLSWHMPLDHTHAWPNPRTLSPVTGAGAGGCSSSSPPLDRSTHSWERTRKKLVLTFH